MPVRVDNICVVESTDVEASKCAVSIKNYAVHMHCCCGFMLST